MIESNGSVEKPKVLRDISHSKSAAVLALLTLIYMTNLIDRQLPFILAESIRKDLDLSDLQLGLLGGVAFAFVYGVMSLPLARFADSWSPKWVLTGCAVTWSLMTSLGAGATSFVLLSMSRVGVAVGEAGCVPSSHALISAIAKPNARGRMLAIFMVGSPMGLMAGLLLGGWVNDQWGWRAAFLYIGAVGVALSLVFALVAPDVRPPRKEKQPTLLAAARHLFAFRSYTHMFVGNAFLGVGGYSVMTFGAPYMIRTFHWTSTQAGVGLGLANGLGAAVGTIVGGFLVDHLAKNRPSLTLWLPAIGLFASALFYAAAFLVHQPVMAMVCLGCALFLNYFYMAPSFAAGQSLAPSNMRATASAILVLSSGLLGASVGPVIVGMLSDALRPRFGDLSLRYALMVVPVMTGCCAVHFVFAARAYMNDLQRACASEAPSEESGTSSQIAPLNLAGTLPGLPS